jgi:aryl-alcohol dehydrogenase-like predicted oxidoreductase
MKPRTIGNQSIGEIGLGCMGMSYAYGKANDEESLQVLSRALEIGVNHWDTADMYGAGDNERLLAKSLKSNRDKVFLATKFGNVTDRTLTTHQDLVDAEAGWIVDGTPEYARKSVELSLQRLGTDVIDLYYLHRVDDRTPIEDTIGEMAKFVEEGKVRFLGVSEVNPETLRRAHSVHPIAAVQNEVSLWTRDSVDDIIPVCSELDIAVVPYSPLGRGFLTGQIKSFDDLQDDDWRRMNPRFQPEQFEINLELVRVVETIGAELNASAAQIALAWVLALSPNVCPIPGTKRIKYLEENAGATNVTLTTAQIETLNSLSEAAGSRYPESFMSFTRR